MNAKNEKVAWSYHAQANLRHKKLYFFFTLSTGFGFCINDTYQVSYPELIRTLDASFPVLYKVMHIMYYTLDFYAHTKPRDGQKRRKTWICMYS